MEPPLKKKLVVLTSLSASSSRDDRKGWCRQKFREEWCTEPEFHGWLEPVSDDPFRAWCKACQCGLTVGRSELLKHANTQKHKRAVEELETENTNSSIMSILDTTSGTDPNATNVLGVLENASKSAQDKPKVFTILETTASGDVKMSFTSSLGRLGGRTEGQHLKRVDEGLMKAELRIAAFAVEHNLSGVAIEHLGALIDSLGERPDIVSKIKMNKKKCVSLVKNVLSKSVQQDLDDILRVTHFSLIVEESASLIGGNRIICLIVRYFSNAKNRIRSELLEAFAVRDEEASDERLNQLLLSVFTNRNIPLENILGIAADRGSIMFRNTDLIQKNLLANNKDVIMFNCTHRSITEVTLCAIQALPNSLEQIAKYLGHHVVMDAENHRCDDDRELTVDDEVVSMDTVGWDSTRWLVEPSCVNQLLRQLPTLEERLEKDTACGKAPIGEALLRELVDPYTKAHLLFLNYILTPLENINQLFRSDEMVIHQLLRECQAQFRVLCQHFLTPSTFMVDDLATVDPYAEQNLLQLKDVFVGFDCQGHLQDLDPELNEFFLMQCRKFFQICVSELQSRIPLNSEFLDQLSFLDPDVALRPEGRAAVPTLENLVSNWVPVKIFDVAKLEQQWQTLPNYFPSPDTDELKKMPIDTMWGVIGDMRGGSRGDELVFGELGKLAKLALSLPLTDKNVASVLNSLFKLHRRRARVGLPRTLDTILPLKHTMASESSDCQKLRITGKHRKFYCLSITKKEDFADDADVFVNEDD